MHKYAQLLTMIFSIFKMLVKTYKKNYRGQMHSFFTISQEKSSLLQRNIVKIYIVYYMKKHKEYIGIIFLKLITAR